MTNLTDSTITIHLAGVERELHATVDAILRLSKGSTIAIDNQGSMITVKGLRQYNVAIHDLDIERILFLLRVGLDSKETDGELLKLCLATEGGIAEVAANLVPYLSLLLSGGKREAQEPEKKQKAAKA
jgi:hypothetical protein